MGVSIVKPNWVTNENARHTFLSFFIDSSITDFKTNVYNRRRKNVTILSERPKSPFRGNSLDKITPEEIEAARQDPMKMDRLIAAHEGFILQIAGKTMKHHVDRSDDEFSIGLIAFHEALNSYDPSRGDFLAFSALVIKRRLLDKLKSDYRHSAEISMDASRMDGSPDGSQEPTALELEVARRQARLSEEAADPSSTPGSSSAADEIEAVQQLLSHYGFSFYDLASCSPKAKKTKEGCALAVRAILASKVLFNDMRASKTLPAREILELTGLPRKILERHRKYIIAASEILSGEYPLLAEYMKFIKEGMET